MKQQWTDRSTSPTTACTPLSLVLLLLSVFGRFVVASNRRFDPWNESASASVLDLYLPSFANYTLPHSYETCDILSRNNQLPQGSALDELAALHAPYLFFHPYERYSLSSVETTFAEATQGHIERIRNNEETPYSNVLDPVALLNSTRDWVLGLDKEEFYFQHQLSEDYVRGECSWTVSTIDESSANMNLSVEYFLLLT